MISDDLVLEIALRMADVNSKERAEAERMMGCTIEQMTIGQRIMAAACIAAFYDVVFMD